MALTSHGRYLASTGMDLTLRLWNLESGKEILKWSPDQSNITAMAFSPDGQTLVTAGNNNTLKVWNIGYI